MRLGNWHSHEPGGKSTAAWLITLVRAGYGAGLVVAPGVLIRLTAGPGAVAGHPGGRGEAAAQREAGARRARLVARVLGVRHLAQAAFTAGTEWADPGNPLPLGGGAAVDVLHAASMFGLGAVDRRVRRTALTDALLETALAAAGAWAAASALTDPRP
jgi:hypothetical protein